MELTRKLMPEWLTVEYRGEQLSFLCAPLTSAQLMNVIHTAQGDSIPGDGLLMACKYAVRDWRGVTEGGAPVPFSQANLLALFDDPANVHLLAKLGSEIIARSRLSEDETKN